MAQVLHASYETSASALYSIDKTALMTFGRDHHRAAKFAPDLALADHHGRVLATMDAFAGDWTDMDDLGKADG